MNKRDAKRIARARAVTLLQQDLDGGGMYTDGDNEDDIAMVEKAMGELIAELDRRAERADWDKIRGEAADAPA